MCYSCLPFHTKLKHKISGFSEMFNSNNNSKFQQLEEEDKQDWWKAGKEDGFDLTRKL